MKFFSWGDVSARTATLSSYLRNGSAGPKSSIPNRSPSVTAGENCNGKPTQSCRSKIPSSPGPSSRCKPELCLLPTISAATLRWVQGQPVPDGSYGNMLALSRDATSVSVTLLAEAPLKMMIGIWLGETPRVVEGSGGVPTRFPLVLCFESDGRVERWRTSLNLFGGRGRNRTYNLSVKS